MTLLRVNTSATKTKGVEIISRKFIPATIRKNTRPCLAGHAHLMFSKWRNIIVYRYTVFE